MVFCWSFIIFCGILWITCWRDNLTNSPTTFLLRRLQICCKAWQEIFMAVHFYAKMMITRETCRLGVGRLAAALHFPLHFQLCNYARYEKRHQTLTWTSSLRMCIDAVIELFNSKILKVSRFCKASKMQTWDVGWLRETLLHNQLRSNPKIESSFSVCYNVFFKSNCKAI